nr:hypothetical protein [Mobiluncus sp. Marseille-Q7826]
MSQRENGEGGIKAMPSGHCAAETPNRKGSSRRLHEPARHSAEALKNGTDVPF